MGAEWERDSFLLSNFFPELHFPVSFFFVQVPVPFPFFKMIVDCQSQWPKSFIYRIVLFSRRFDFVELTDSSGQRIERLDGSRSGFAITVGGNRTTLLNIRLTTDGSVVRQGFLAQYTITVGE